MTYGKEGVKEYRLKPFKIEKPNGEIIDAIWCPDCRIYSTVPCSKNHGSSGDRLFDEYVEKGLNKLPQNRAAAQEILKRNSLAKSERSVLPAFKDVTFDKNKVPSWWIDRLDDHKEDIDDEDVLSVHKMLNSIEKDRVKHAVEREVERVKKNNVRPIDFDDPEWGDLVTALGDSHDEVTYKRRMPDGTWRESHLRYNVRKNRWEEHEVSDEAAIVLASVANGTDRGEIDNKNSDRNGTSVLDRVINNVKGVSKIGAAKVHKTFSNQKMKLVSRVSGEILAQSDTAEGMLELLMDNDFGVKNLKTTDLQDLLLEGYKDGKVTTHVAPLSGTQCIEYLKRYRTREHVDYYDTEIEDMK